MEKEEKVQQYKLAAEELGCRRISGFRSFGTRASGLHASCLVSLRSP